MAGQHQLSSPQTEMRSAITLLDLDDDVLIHAVSDLSTNDALNFSLVARRVHLIAKHQALSCVTMKSIKCVSRICTYMLADVPGRLKWIRRLSVSVLPPRPLPLRVQSKRPDYVRNVQEATASMHLLVLLVRHATALKYLHLKFVDQVLAFQPTLIDVLSSLTNVAELELLHACGAETFKLLDRLQCRPRGLFLQIGPEIIDKDALFSHIGKWQQLQTLRLVGSNIIQDQRDSDTDLTKCFMSDLPHSWPDVTNLSLARCEIALPAILRAFPNLHVLTIMEWSRGPCFSNPSRPVYLSQTREHGLEFVEGSAHFFQNWPSARPVYHILIQSVLAIPIIWDAVGPTRCGDPDIPILLQMVCRAKPVVLTLRAMAFKSLQSTFWAGMAAEATRLRCLEVELCLFRETEGLTTLFLQWMQTVPATLSNVSSLSYVQVCINDQISSSMRSDIVSDFDGSQATAEAMAYALVGHIPSLEYVSIVFGRMPLDWSSTLYIEPFHGLLWTWKVNNISGERTLLPISATLASRIKERLKSPAGMGHGHLEEMFKENSSTSRNDVSSTHSFAIPDSEVIRVPADPSFKGT